MIRAAKIPVRLALPALAAVILAAGCTSYKAPEISGIRSWINSGPLTIEEQRGNVVLVDFWTYTCVNCIRTFPYLRDWQGKYSDAGLVIIGVHSPEFEFEKEYSNVLQATREHGITWAVAQDNDFETWRNFANSFWPAKYLIDKDGIVRYTHFGEGAYDDTEERIRELLVQAGADLSDIPYDPPQDQAVDQTYIETRNAPVTRELYAGFVRAEFGDTVRQSGYYNNTGSVVELEAPDDLKSGYIYFDGTWIVLPESTRHGRTTTGYEDTLSVVFSARSLNAVLTSESSEPYTVRVMLDGEFLTDENKGQDVTIGDNGISYVTVDEPRMYSVVDAPAYAKDRTLQMSSNSEDFGIFALTFGVYQEGP